MKSIELYKLLNIENREPDRELEFSELESIVLKEIQKRVIYCDIDNLSKEIKSVYLLYSSSEKVVFAVPGGKLLCLSVDGGYEYSFLRYQKRYAI